MISNDSPVMYNGDHPLNAADSHKNEKMNETIVECIL